MTRRRFLSTVLALGISPGLAPWPALAQGAKPSPAFERFRQSFFEEDSARDGLDTEALLQLEGEERKRAEDMLIRQLPDARAAIGLGELRSQRAQPQLARLFEAERWAQRAAQRNSGDWFPFKLLILAKALWQIRPDPDALAAITEVLASAQDDLQRQEAAEALAVVHDPAAVHALVK